MKTRITIHSDSTGSVQAEIDDTKNPVTSKRILDALPITASAQLWGDEIYFSIPVTSEEEIAQIEVEVGDIAYWPPGTSFCIFFGQTPASRGEKPAAASPVNVFGSIIGDASVFTSVRSGEKITIDRA